MNKLHITRKQWIFFLRWAVYGAMFLLAMALQGTILSRLSIFGVKLNLLPACIICVALQEGQERGGVFALCASTVLALAGADFGYLSIAVLTFSAVFCAWLCRALFYHTLPSTALCCLGAWLVNETCIFLLRLLLGSVEPMQYLLVLLPGALLSLVGCPVFYYLVASDRENWGLIMERITQKRVAVFFVLLAALLGFFGLPAVYCPGGQRYGRRQLNLDLYLPDECLRRTRPDPGPPTAIS